MCDRATAAGPAYPARTPRRPVASPHPRGAPLARWRDVRDAIGAMSRDLVRAIGAGEALDERVLGRRARGAPDAEGRDG